VDSGVLEVHLETKMGRYRSPSVEVNLEADQTTNLECQPRCAWWQAQRAMLHPGEWIELTRDD
jgi:hypothetical protein